MKKTIFLLLLLSCTTLTFAQVNLKSTNPAATGEDSFAKVDSKPAKVYQVTLQLDQAGIIALTATPEDWVTLKRSPQLTGQQISDLEDLAARIRVEIIRQKQLQEAPTPAFSTPKLGKSNKTESQ